MPNPHGGRRSRSPIARSSRCARRRKRSRAKLAELIQFGEENDVISEKVHRLVRRDALRAHALDRAPRALLQPARGFRRPACGHAAVARDGRYARIRRRERRAARRSPPASTRRFAGRTRTSRPPAGSARPRRDIRSVAFIPLRELDQTFGLLALASEDSLRFYPEMGTLYLKRIGEMVSAALLRFV